MSVPGTSTRTGESGFRTAHLLLFLSVVFLALFIASWPVVFSFDLWVFNDRGNLLNVESLLDSGLRLGVDTYYSYGLLPTLLQHLAFTFGSGYWPMLGLSLAALFALAFVWAHIFHRLPRSPAWLVATL
jgi:hypothetical protein